MTTAMLSQSLLKWYDASGRILPWRVKGGAHPDPYVVLVSEFMLQQTTVKTVIPYFQRFIQRFPTVQTLANAELEEVYAYWQGLGYYTRARSLYATARMIVERGSFPQTPKDALKLKGIGNYTAASFLALAFNMPATVVDGNVIRIICRMYHLTGAISEISGEIRAKAEALADRRRPADYASAIMDLGALICTPKNPQCLLCPWQAACLSKSAPDLENIPNRGKLPKKEKNGRVYLINDANGNIFIRKRTEKGLLSGLYEFPWSDNEDAPVPAGAKDSGLQISHVFTHFKLTLKIFMLTTEKPSFDGCFIVPQNLQNYPFSTLMKKVYRRAGSVLSKSEEKTGKTS